MSTTEILKKSDIRTLMKYEFFKKTGAAEAARRINSAYGQGVVSERTVRLRFERFRSGNFDLTNEPRGRPDFKINNEQLKAAVKKNPTKSARELAIKFQVSKPTILRHLAEIGIIKKPKKVNKS